MLENFDPNYTLPLTVFAGELLSSATMSFVPGLPSELIAAIIDEVCGCETPIESLKALALVSKAFRPYAQKHLFSSVSLVFPDWQRLSSTRRPPPHVAQALLTALNLKPELARHVKHLSILDYSEQYWRYDFDQQIYEQPDTVLPRVFNAISRYTSLISFTLAGRSDYEDSIVSECDRDPLSWSMICATLGLCSRTKVAEVNITLVPFIPLGRLVTLCPKLKRLRLEWSGGLSSARDVDTELELEEDKEETELMDKLCAALQVFDRLEPQQVQVLEKLFNDPGFIKSRWLEDRSVYSNVWQWHSRMHSISQTIAQLESLILDERSLPCVFRLIDHELPGGTSAVVALYHLRELCVAGTSSALLYLTSCLIYKASRNLEIFAWDVRETEVFTAPFNEDIQINLGLFAPAMRTLRFSLLGPWYNEFTFLPCVVNALERLHRSETLRELFISYTWSPFFPFPPTYLQGEPYLLESDASAWASKLNALLSSTSSFPRLQKVVIVVAYKERWFAIRNVNPGDEQRVTLAQAKRGLEEQLVGLRDRNILIVEWVPFEKRGKWEVIDRALARF